MAITISGENNNDRILASDGVIDEISGINIVGVITATTFVGNLTGNVTGNLTGNVNSTSPLLLQTDGGERFRITGNNELGIAGANYGSSGQVLTSGGSGSAVSWTTPATQTTINSNTNNYLITGTGTANTLQGESSLTWDGSKLLINKTSSFGSVPLQVKGTSSGLSDGGQIFDIGTADGSSGTRLAFGVSEDNFGWIRSYESGVGGRDIVFAASEERMRITSTGLVGIATNSPSAALLDIATDQGSNDQLRLRRLSSDSNVAANWSFKPYAGNLYFRSGGSTDKIYFDDSGDINIMDGNLVIATAGHGIDFSATPNGYAGSIQERLDDYEEGYWTPTVGGWSASGTGVYGTGGQKGRYTKIGNTVTVFFHIYWTALNNASGVFAIESLPFPHASNQYYFSTAVQMRYVDYSGDTVFAIGGHDYSSSLLLYAQNDNGNHNYVPIDSNGGRIEGCVTYLTDS